MGDNKERIYKTGWEGNIIYVGEGPEKRRLVLDLVIEIENVKHNAIEEIIVRERVK